ncbi:hypothetical protein [Acinetobacter sp. MD2(2019)]|uniref:hypothetical protein n=1 Tax=Acinetobacter sp. MD2(2019) TaxID=2605273 RepID=UPI002D1F6896|nr:hypothetical protein [Acinetobacter sp. MD2(2019)]MEB3753829.1 hypothetical protein [Acinetobacter sp. MD2(2019)]
MSNPYQKLLDLLPKTPEFIGTITYASHPNYKVLVVDGTGLLLCTSSTQFSVGNRVFVAGTEIKRSALAGTVATIEV